MNSISWNPSNFSLAQLPPPEPDIQIQTTPPPQPDIQIQTAPPPPEFTPPYLVSPLIGYPYEGVSPLSGFHPPYLLGNEDVSGGVGKPYLPPY